MQREAKPAFIVAAATLLIPNKTDAPHAENGQMTDNCHDACNAVLRDKITGHERRHSMTRTINHTGGQVPLSFFMMISFAACDNEPHPLKTLETAFLERPRASAIFSCALFQNSNLMRAIGIKIRAGYPLEEIGDFHIPVPPFMLESVHRMPSEIGA